MESTVFEYVDEENDTYLDVWTTGHGDLEIAIVGSVLPTAHIIVPNGEALGKAILKELENR